MDSCLAQEQENFAAMKRSTAQLVQFHEQAMGQLREQHVVASQAAKLREHALRKQVDNMQAQRDACLAAATDAERLLTKFV